MNNKFYPPSCVRTMRAPTPSTRNMTRQCYKLVVYPLMLASDKYYYIKLVIHLLSNTVVRPPRRSGATNQGSDIGSHRKKRPLVVYTCAAVAGANQRLGPFLDLTMQFLQVASLHVSSFFWSKKGIVTHKCFRGEETI